MDGSGGGVWDQRALAIITGQGRNVGPATDGENSGFSIMVFSCETNFDNLSYAHMDTHKI